MTDIRVAGAEKLSVLSRRFKATDNKAMRRELYRGLNRATKPARTAAQQRARRELPHRGGLADRVAKSRMTTQIRHKGTESRVSIIAKSADSIRQIDQQGLVRHPVFGNRDVWVSQPVRPGWFTQAMTANQSVVRREMVELLDRISKQVSD